MNHTAKAGMLLVFSVSLLGLGGEQVLLDETAAVIAAKLPSQKSVSVITRWELEAKCRLESVLRYGRDGLDRTISKQLRSEVLEAMIDEMVVFMELQRLGSKEPDKKLYKNKLRAYTENFQSKDEFFTELAKLSISSKQVQSWLEQSALVDQYVDAQFHMDAAGFSDAAAEDFEIEKQYFRGGLIEDYKKRYRIWVFYEGE
ncbi:MAG: hypothetical protein ABIJ56_00815 [Pseudomonadota bacterium]